MDKQSQDYSPPLNGSSPNGKYNYILEDPAGQGDLERQVQTTSRIPLHPLILPKPAIKRLRVPFVQAYVPNTPHVTNP